MTAESMRAVVRRNVAPALERLSSLDGYIRLQLGCAMAQTVTWCPICGEVHMVAAKCARPERASP